MTNQKENNKMEVIKPIVRRTKELGLQEFYAPNRCKNKYEPNECANNKAKARRVRQGVAK